MTEEWKPFEFNGFTGKYDISDMGRFRNSYSHEIIKLQEREGKNILRFRISDDEENEKTDNKINVGRQVLTCFVRKPTRGEYCNHINGDGTDDRLENLEWTKTRTVNQFKGTPIKVEYKDNNEIVQFDCVKDAADSLDVKIMEIYDSMRDNNNTVRILDHVIISYIRKIPSEYAIKKEIKFGEKKIKVSSDGFVCLGGTEKWKRGSVQRGYMRTSFQFNENGEYIEGGKGKNYDIHRLVAIAFHDNPLGLSDVDHIDEDKLNNNYENLRWLSHSDNAKRSIKPGSRNKQKVYKYKIGGEYTGESFESLEFAAKNIGLTSLTTISGCINSKRPQSGNFEWSIFGPEEYKSRREGIMKMVKDHQNKEKEDRDAKKGPKKETGKRVYAHVIGTSEILEWESGKDASSKVGIGTGNLCNYIKNKKIKVIDLEGKSIKVQFSRNKEYFDED